MHRNTVLARSLTIIVHLLLTAVDCQDLVVRLFQTYVSQMLPYLSHNVGVLKWRLAVFTLRTRLLLDPCSDQGNENGLWNVIS
jgi:hypothetical protein